MHAFADAQHAVSATTATPSRRPDRLIDLDDGSLKASQRQLRSTRCRCRRDVRARQNHGQRQSGRRGELSRVLSDEREGIDTVPMRHVMYAEKSLLMDDASADALIDYAAALAEAAGGDSVRLVAVGDDGNEVEVAFLLNSATVLIIESASADLEMPANDDAVRIMRQKADHIRHPPEAQTQAPSGLPDFDFDFDEIH